MTLFGIHLFSLGLGVVLAQFLPVTVGLWIKNKLAAAKAAGVSAAATPLVAKVEAEVKKVI
jgi:hypothetical protein